MKDKIEERSSQLVRNLSSCAKKDWEAHSKWSNTCTFASFSNITLCRSNDDCIQKHFKDTREDNQAGKIEKQFKLLTAKVN